LESFGVIMLCCMILFGMVQLVLMFTATEIVQYAADASARARAVGFNRFMVYKVNRVATIPNAGLMTQPERRAMGNADAWAERSAGESFFTSLRSNPRSSQYWEIEEPSIPLYLGAEQDAHLSGILDYEDWDTVGSPSVSLSGSMIQVRLNQTYPLRMPLWRAFTGRDEIRIEREARLANHAELYLQ